MHKFERWRLYCKRQYRLLRLLWCCQNRVKNRSIFRSIHTEHRTCMIHLLSIQQDQKKHLKNDQRSKDAAVKKDLIQVE